MDLGEVSHFLTSVLKLKLEPIGIKMLKGVEDLEKLGVKPFGKNLAFCQYLKAAALYGRPYGLTPDNCDACVVGSRILGFKDIPPDLEKRWCELNAYTPDVFKKLIEKVHALPLGSYGAALVAPLRFFSLKNLEPDSIMLFVNSAQAYILLVSFFDHTGVKPWSDFNGHAACEAVTAAMTKSSPWLTIPCGGARALAEAQDDELWMAFKPSDLAKAVERLRKTKFGYYPPILQMPLIPPQPEFVLTKLISREG